jgi:glycosyltransferase involved in cell wall biosynthesis
MQYKISLVIPCRDDNCKIFTQTLKAIAMQTLQPDEVIIIDSSSTDDIQLAIEESAVQNIVTCYKRIPPAFAGLSTNLGISIAQCELIALLDSKTLPEKAWLEAYLKFLQEKSVDIIFGKTKFNYTTSFQRVVRAASYGNIPHETVPGSLFFKEVGMKVRFKENLRAGYDLDWKERLQEKFDAFTPLESFITYAQFPSNIKDLATKYFIYSFYTGMISANKSIKDLYVSITLIITALLIPRWNLMLADWEESILYIPDITKKYLLTLVVLFLALSILSAFFQQALKKLLLYKTLKVILSFFAFYCIYNWNAEIALWAEDAVYYIPHITKIFITLVLTSSIVLRGVIQPIRKKEDINYLLPFRWLQIGCIGLLMDAAKAPGLIFGSIRGRFGLN